MARQPVLFTAPTAVPTTPALAYTAPSYVPTTLRSVVKQVHVQNPAGSAVAFSMSINGTAAANRVFDGYSIAASAVLDHYCYYPLSPAGSIGIWADGNNVLVATISGDENM